MRHKPGGSIIYLVLIVFLSVGVFTSHALWQNFGGSNTYGRLWSFDLTDVCLDAVRVGFATNYYYSPSDEEPDKDKAVYAFMAVTTKPKENVVNELVPHKVHPPRQPAPIFVDDNQPDPPTPRDFHTMLNIPFVTPHSSPIALESVYLQGTDSGGLGFNSENWTMQDCYLLKGVSNGTMEIVNRSQPKFPFGWNTSKLGSGDRLMCDRVKHETLPDKFYSFEAGVLNPLPTEEVPDPDPDINPGCAFRFLGKAGKVSMLFQKNTNVADFEVGDTVTLVAHAHGKQTGKNNVKIKLVVKYPGKGNQQVINATAQPGDKINQAYIEFKGSGILTAAPKNIKTIIRFDDPKGTLYVDGVYIRLDKAELKLTSPTSGTRERSGGWVTLPESQK